MKRWRETQQIFDRLAELHHAKQRAALATIVRVHGSAYRRAGAKLLVAEDGSTCGNLSGGCLEQGVREVGLQVIQSGRSQLRRYCTAIPYIGILGPRHRTDQLLESLDMHRSPDRCRIHGPVGLDLGAEGAEQIAVAILAEILAIHAGRDASFLRRRAGAIHDAAV